MKRFVAGLSLTSLLLIASACERSANQAEGGRESIARPTADSMAASPESLAGESAASEQAAGQHAATGHAATGHAAAGEGQALLPIMQKLGSEMTTLTYALMKSDYQNVERSAAAIAEHVPISAEELERIHTVLGPEMAKFEAMDESVHVASVHLHEAARARQPGQVVERLGEVQRGCVSCHEQFRERLLTNRGGQ